MKGHQVFGDKKRWISALYYHHTHLYSSLRKINLHGQIFPREDVRVVSLREGGLEFLQLLEGESCPVSPLLPPHEGIFTDSVQCWVIGGVTSICNESGKSCEIVVYFMRLQMSVSVIINCSYAQFYFPMAGKIKTHSVDNASDNNNNASRVTVNSLGIIDANINRCEKYFELIFITLII